MAVATTACAGTVKGPQAQQMVKDGALLLDVRTREEFAEKHIDGALNIPVQELEQRLEEVGAKDRPVVVYCRSGARSDRAMKLLKAEGWKTVENLGPMSAWDAK